jgi:small Trp-rich protein
MPVLIIGILLAGLKYMEVGPFAKISWLWVVLPFAIVIVWWEVMVPILGLDKKKEHADAEMKKKQRMEKNRSGRSNNM